KLKGEYRIKSRSSDDDFYRTDIQFNSYYFQPSVYYCFHTNGAVLKLIAACKFENVSFSSFNVSFINKNDFSNPNFSLTNTADNPAIRIITPYMGMRYEYKQLFFDIQYGNRNVQDTFQARQTSSQTGGRNISNPLNNQLHPLFERGMLNITVGLKFSPFGN
ncbi:MAG TPA: hypothetical protein VEC12_08365, partial [Bacteroidia bacterium]|nr:hypothetical protein [Bacteroidia bacterium]